MSVAAIPALLASEPALFVEAERVAAAGPGPAVWFAAFLARRERQWCDPLPAKDSSWSELGLSRNAGRRARKAAERAGWVTTEIRRDATGTPVPWNSLVRTGDEDEP